MTKYFFPLPLLALFLVLPLLVACERQYDTQAEFVDLAVNTRCDREPGCSAITEGFAATILIGPGARALRPFPVHVHLSHSVPVTEIFVEFNMAGMQMGLNRYRLVREGDGFWRAQVTLPVCVSGRSDWMAKFELLTDDRQIRVDAPFGLKK